MTALIVPVGSTPGELSRRWPTPRWLMLLSSVIVVLAVGLGVFVASSASAVRSGFDVIGQQAAPQVKVSSDLYFALADLDAQAANVLLVGDSLPQSRTAALTTYDQRRTQADADLEQDAADAGGDPRITAELNQLGQYEGLVAQAFLLDQSAPEGKPTAAAMTQYRQATNLMAGILLSAQTLITNNHNLLNNTAAAQRSDITGERVVIVMLGVLLVAALLAIQVFLRLRQRRRLNPALVGATVLGLVLTFVGIGVLSSASNQLYVAKTQAFDSIIALSQARSVSYDANADESRYLLDQQDTVEFQGFFTGKSNQVQQDIQDELNNITFAGEQQAADSMSQAWDKYQKDDGLLRQLARSNMTSAIAFDINPAPGASDGDFTAFDNALLKTVQINQGAFDTAVRDGQDGVSAWTLWIPGLGVLVMLALVGVGVWPRLSEYWR